MLKKQKERNKRNKIKKQNQQFERLYPKFSFYKEDTVEPELVKLVKDAVNFLFNPNNNHSRNGSDKRGYNTW